MVAAQIGQPHWELTEDEARAVTTAGLDVLSFYPVKASEKAIAWGMLAYALGTVYGSRIIGSVLASRSSRPAPAARGQAPASSVGIGPIAPEGRPTAGRPPAQAGAAMVEVSPGVFAPRIDA
jgi:hypothetical protein